MIRSIETTGKTKELAIRAALEQLKLTEDDITYEILELGRSGFLGIGAVPARVRVSYDDGQSEPKPVKTQPVKAPAKKPRQRLCAAGTKLRQRDDQKTDPPHRQAPPQKPVPAEPVPPGGPGNAEGQPFPRFGQLRAAVRAAFADGDFGFAFPAVVGKGHGVSSFQMRNHFFGQVGHNVRLSGPCYRRGDGTWLLILRFRNYSCTAGGAKSFSTG